MREFFALNIHHPEILVQAMAELCLCNQWYEELKLQHFFHAIFASSKASKSAHVANLIFRLPNRAIPATLWFRKGRYLPTDQLNGQDPQNLMSRGLSSRLRGGLVISEMNFQAN